MHEEFLMGDVPHAWCIVRYGQAQFVEAMPLFADAMQREANFLAENQKYETLLQ